jgi:predicted DNA-binding transcriptional regulator YafY
MFNEIYGAYYDMMRRILEKASSEPVSAQDIRRIVSGYGFSESSLYFTPDVLAQDGTGFSLLKKTPSCYMSILRNKPIQCLTLNQKRLIKTLLQDKRIHLFLDDTDILGLNATLEDIEPLYNMDDIILTETAADSDDYEGKTYREHFKTVLLAVKQKRMLKVVYNSSRGERRTVKIAPYKFEYGVRDDKFRLCGVSVFKDKPTKYIKLNVARMLQIIPLEIPSDVDFKYFIERKMLKQPITVEISDFRNGFERIFIGLSNYKRTSSLNDETGKCTMQIECMDDDVQELLIILLSYGPAIRVIGPPEFKEKYIERVKKQIEMLKAGE